MSGRTVLSVAITATKGFPWPPSCAGLERAGNLLIIPTAETFSGFSRLFLCEKQEARVGDYDLPLMNQVQKVNSTSAPTGFPVASCSSGHYTHVFLACDVQSACQQRGNVGGSDGRDDSAAVLCTSTLEMLFTCRNGVEHVPYSLVCDHLEDCLDSSDENFCVHPPCSGSGAV